MNLTLAIAVIVLAYLLGSIPFGLLLTRMAGAGDIRTIGSGNIGATNVLRTGNKKLAAATLLADVLKGVLAVMIAREIAPEAAACAALAAFLGHLFPVWLKFKGGKGVATALGVFLGLAPQVALAALLVWLMAAYLLRISSASALIAVASAPMWVKVFGQPQNLWLACLIAALVFFTHRANILRLIHGTEPQIGQKKQNEQTNAHAG